MFRLYLVNFGFFADRPDCATIPEAIEAARAIGFEVAIVAIPSMRTVGTVRPIGGTWIAPEVAL